jgi:hypothetical protein
MTTMTEHQPEAPAGDHWQRKAQPAVVIEDPAELDARRVEAAAAVLERRYPAARPDVLDTVISELHSIARAWRRMAASSAPPVAAPAADAGPADPRSPAPAAAEPVAAATRAAEAIRIRMARALYDSTGRCARCKVCEHQCGAAANVAVEAVSAERERAEAAEAKLAALAATIPPERFRAIADWFDTERGRDGLE